MLPSLASGGLVVPAALSLKSNNISQPTLDALSTWGPEAKSPAPEAVLLTPEPRPFLVFLVTTTC